MYYSSTESKSTSTSTSVVLCVGYINRDTNKCMVKKERELVEAHILINSECILINNL